MHSMQAGYLEKAQKYTDKALMQLEKLKSECFVHFYFYYLLLSISLQKWSAFLASRQHFDHSVAVLDCSPILSTFQVILLEHIIMCRLVTGHKATALQEVRRSSIYLFLSALGWFNLPAQCCPSHSWLFVFCIQISQVCQLCQQSPRLFTNHAAQLHTLLVSKASNVSAVESSGEISKTLRYVKVE